MKYILMQGANLGGELELEDLYGLYNTKEERDANYASTSLKVYPLDLEDDNPFVVKVLTEKNLADFEKVYDVLDMAKNSMRKFLDKYPAFNAKLTDKEKNFLYE